MLVPVWPGTVSCCGERTWRGVEPLDGVCDVTPCCCCWSWWAWLHDVLLLYCIEWSAERNSFSSASWQNAKQHFPLWTIEQILHKRLHMSGRLVGSRKCLPVSFQSLREPQNVLEPVDWSCLTLRLHIVELYIVSVKNKCLLTYTV